MIITVELAQEELDILWKHFRKRSLAVITGLDRVLPEDEVIRKILMAAKYEPKDET